MLFNKVLQILNLRSKNLIADNKYIHLDLLKEAIHEYRKEGKRLMFELGRKYDLNISKIDDYERLISKSNSNVPRSGALSKRWNYYFHGSECGFYNKKHQLKVEVVLSNAPDFGHIDSWFLLTFMESKDKYKDEVKGIDWLKLKLQVDKLYQLNEIEKVDR